MSLLTNARQMSETKPDKHIKRTIITNVLDNDSINNINYTEVRIDRESIDNFFKPMKEFDLDKILGTLKSWHDFYQCCVYYMMYGVSDETMRYRTVIIYRSTDKSFKPMEISVIKLAFCQRVVGRRVILQVQDNNRRFYFLDVSRMMIKEECLTWLQTIS